MSSPVGISRREFMKGVGAAGVGAVLGGASCLAGAPATVPATAPAAAFVPTRRLGKTGAVVPSLGFGGSFDIQANGTLLGQALKRGVAYWDTAESYARGRSEQGIGEHFQKHPEDRKKVFLICKGFTREPERLGALLRQSLERLRTDWIDLYYVHALTGPEELERWGKQWQAWGEQQKKSGRIRLFGFTTHKNMAGCLSAAAGLGWVDAMMFTYNYRVMGEEKLRAGIAACHKAGKGLVAMKVMALGQFEGCGGEPSEPEKRLLERFRPRGMSLAQAKLKAIWSDERIAAIVTRMDTPERLGENAAAAADGEGLSAGDIRALTEHARASRQTYCAACGACESAMGGGVPICDVMRCLMYLRGYGEPDRARSAFAALPAAGRGRLATADYSGAERACPRGLPIGRLMTEAASALA